MSRMIFVPQYPTRMRYQEWWIDSFEEEFIFGGFKEVITLGSSSLLELKEKADYGFFSPLDMSIKFESIQIKEFMSLKLKEDDTLFISDLSFPGFFPHVLFHKRPSKVFAFCHATSKNYLDYYSKDVDNKFPIETAISKMCDKVFVGSYYHQRKLGWKNTVVTYLPFFDYFKQKSPINVFGRRNLIMSASRDNPQKIHLPLENRVEEEYGEIFRPISESWDDYSKNLLDSKILLITSFEDTFGYQIIDGILHGCIVIAPNRCAYPEILPREYLYDYDYDLLKKIDNVINGELSVPKILCEEQMNNFYKKITNEMKL